MAGLYPADAGVVDRSTGRRTTVDAWRSVR